MGRIAGSKLRVKLQAVEGEREGTLDPAPPLDSAKAALAGLRARAAQLPVEAFDPDSMDELEADMRATADHRSRANAELLDNE